MYAKTEWTSGTYVTPTVMNNIENGLEKVSGQLCAKAITSGDLNDYKETGIYYITSGNVANITNIPVNSGGWILHVFGDGVRVEQSLYRLSSSEEYRQYYFRTYAYSNSVGTWYPWTRLVKESETYYQVGDTVTFDADIYCPAVYTSSGKSIIITVPMNKSLDLVNGVNLSSLKLSIRFIGGYVRGYKNGSLLSSEQAEYVGADNISIVTTIHKSAKALKFRLNAQNSSDWYYQTGTYTLINNSSLIVGVQPNITFT